MNGAFRCLPKEEEHVTPELVPAGQVWNPTGVGPERPFRWMAAYQLVNNTTYAAAKAAWRQKAVETLTEMFRAVDLSAWVKMVGTLEDDMLAETLDRMRAVVESGLESGGKGGKHE